MLGYSTYGGGYYFRKPEQEAHGPLEWAGEGEQKERQRKPG